MAKEFEGKTIFITGAGKGQGRAVALGFAKEGANVIAFDLGEKIPYPAYNRSSNEDLEKLKDDVEELGGKIVIYGGDVRKAADVKEAVEQGIKEFGSIDILFSNAGIAAYGKSHELEEKQWDAMIDIYERYGYHIDQIETLTLKGIEGLEKIKSIMEQLKAHTPTEIGGLKTLWARNYDNDTATNMLNKAVIPTGLPKSNVVYYEFEGGAWLCVRPSGTEPKIKFYYGVVGENFEDAQKKSDSFRDAVRKMIDYML